MKKFLLPFLALGIILLSAPTAEAIVVSAGDSYASASATTGGARAVARTSKAYSEASAGNGPLVIENYSGPSVAQTTASSDSVSAVATSSTRATTKKPQEKKPETTLATSHTDQTSNSEATKPNPSPSMPAAVSQAIDSDQPVINQTTVKRFSSLLLWITILLVIDTVLLIALLYYAMRGPRTQQRF